MQQGVNLRCSRRTRSFSKPNGKRHPLTTRIHIRQIRRSLDEPNNSDIYNKLLNAPKLTKKDVKRRISMPDMPNLNDDGDDDINPPSNENVSASVLNQELKKEKNQEQATVPSTSEKPNKIAELNKQIFSSNDLQKLNDHNRELNNNLDVYIVEQKLKTSAEPVTSNRSPAKIATLSSELSKVMESEKALRSQNAELIRSKAIAESHLQDLSRKLDAANQCIADYEAKMTKMTLKNAELQAKCTKMQSEMDEMRSKNEKSMDEACIKWNEKLKSQEESMLAKIKIYESDIVKREKHLSTEKEQLHSERMQLRNGIAELTSKFERYQKRQDDYVRKLDNECSTRITSLLNENRGLETKLSTIKNEMRNLNEEMRRSKKDKPNHTHARHHQSSGVSLKAIAARYHRTSKDMYSK